MVMKSILVVALLAISPLLQAQSLQGIAKTVVRDAITGKTGEFLAGANVDPREEDDPYKRFWDNTKYAPFVLDGYRLFRSGSAYSGLSKYRFGVAGWHNCDGAVLMANLTNQPLSVATKDKCTAQEQWIQQGAGKAGHEHPQGWPMWKDYVDQRQRDFSQLPLRLYYRFDFMSVKEERPDGVILHFGTSMKMLGFPGFAHDSSSYDITLKGPDVVDDWDQWIGMSSSSAVRQRQDRGHVRVMVNLRKDQRDAVMRSDRTMAWDTVFYTIQSVRQIAPKLGNRPHYEVTLTVDKVVLGLDQGFNPPVNRLVF